MTDSVVEATLPLVRPVVADMIQINRVLRLARSIAWASMPTFPR